MSDERGLLRAIIADPDDDTPRLVYADWLQEHDRAEEAELVRVQCRLEASAPDHSDYVEWQAREEELKLWLSAHVPGPRVALRAGLKVEDGPGWWKWTRRGFPRFLEFEGYGRPGLKPVRELAKALEGAFAALPTRWVVVRFVTVAQLAELFRHPVAEQLERITVQLGVDEGGGDEAAAVIADSRLRNLRGANLAFQFGEAGAAALARSGNFGRVEWLTVDQTFTDEAVRLLGASGWFRNLLSLDFDGYLPDPAFEELCRLEPFPRLRTLELCGTFSVAAWREFARSETFPALTRLNVRGSVLTEGRAAALASAFRLRLAHLNLTNCAMGNAGAKALAVAPWLASLRHLELFGNLLTASGVAALARAPKLTGLKHLSLANNHLGPLGLRSLAASPALRGLTTLLLGGGAERDRGLKPAHFRDFLTRLDTPKLRHLSLSYRPVGGRAARLLASDKFQALTRLALNNCELTDAAVAELLAAPALQNLIELDLRYNKLGDGLAPLADSALLPRLSSCDLSGNRIDTTLGKRLRRRAGVTLDSITRRGASPPMA